MSITNDGILLLKARVRHCGPNPPLQKTDTALAAANPKSPRTDLHIP